MENKRLFGRICRLHRYLSRENNYLFAEYGITPIQIDTLVYVLICTKEGKKVCQKDIEKHVNLRASSVSTLITTLEKKGFLIRTVAEGDARTKYITLTENGRLICKKNKALVDKCDKLLQSALTEEEQEIFKDLLNKTIAEIENHEKEV